MRIGAFVKRYRWWLLALLLFYAAVTVWLSVATDDPQQVPFEYQVF